MSAVSIRSVVHPPVLVMVCGNYPSTEPTKQNKAAKPKKKFTNKGKTGEDPDERIEISDDSDENNNVDFGNFVMSLEVVVEGVEYVWVGAILHSPGHFWSVLWYEDKVWEYGLGTTNTVKVRTGISPGQPFTVPSGKKFQRCKPEYIIYVQKDLVMQNVD